MTARVLSLVFLLIPALAGCAGIDPLKSFRTDLTQRPLNEMPPIPAFDLEELAAEHEKEPAYFFDIERTLEHVFLLPTSAVWVYVEDLRQSYVVLDAEEERYTTFRTTLADRERLDGVFLRTTSPTGEVRTYTELDLIRDQEDDRTTYRFAYPAVEKGTVIEESIRTSREWEEGRYQPPLYLDAPLQREVPVGRFAFRYVYPVNWALEIKQIGPRQIPPYELDRSSYADRTVVTFFGDDLPSFPDEPYSPFFKEVAPYLEMQVTSISNPYGGPPMYESAKTWEEINQRFGRYAFDRGGRGYNEAIGLAQTLTSGLETDSAKTAAIVTWVQNNIEVEGDAEDLADVLRERKGDAFMIAALANAILTEAEIESDFILIHPVSDGYFDRTFISGTQFTTPAVRVTIDSEEMVVFPFIEGLPISYIPEVYQGADAVVIRKEGLASFIKVPTREADTYAVDDDYIVEIDEDGVVRVEETTTLRGIAGYLMRETFEGLTTEERDEEARELLTYSEGEVEDFEYEIQALSEHGEPLVIVLRYTIPDLVTVTPEEVIFQTGGLLSPASLSAFEVTPGERQLPIRIHYDQITNKKIQIRYPSNWTLATELEDTATRSRFGDVRGIYTLAPGVINADQRIFLKESSATPRSYSALLRLTGSESDLYVPTLVFTIGG